MITYRQAAPQCAQIVSSRLESFCEFVERCRDTRLDGICIGHYSPTPKRADKGPLGHHLKFHSLGLYYLLQSEECLSKSDAIPGDAAIFVRTAVWPNPLFNVTDEQDAGAHPSTTSH